ncbi:non-ribosomal peptide synthetase [Flavobacterium lipolyticum]|uniref:Amino acid adenylation domain-containing protein n=1 Tax=Flavobacterium lipolyticum TaxID=2893754 RepID=A0ABS8M3R9_9FLAO|nr:non-ribosomal peptide synthetase [Flavobacterium sp. F-126]MCC9018863.1 amino acid adenylation domain-containing protein [Flavobacterium sp. F-126]
MKNNVTNVQKYIWLDQILDNESPKYNIGGYAFINGSVDVERFKTAFNILIKENDIFSFVFEEKSGFPAYTLQETNSDLALTCIEESDESKAIQRIEKDFIVPFDIEKDKQLYKMWLIQTAPETYIWYSKLHHIIADGFSFQLLFNKVKRIYEQLGTAVVYDELCIEKNKMSYESFIALDNAYRASDDFSNDRKFWLGRYENLPSLIYTGTNKSASHSNIEMALTEAENEALWAFVKAERLSIFHLLIGCFSIVLSKYYNREEINLGMPILNRKNAAEKNTFGPFLSMLPLKLSLETTATVSDFIKEIKSTLFMCYRHQRFQQADILRNLPQETSKLYDVRLSYERMQYESEFSGHKASIHPLSNDSEEDPISIHVFEGIKGDLSFRFDINEKYVSKFEANQLIASFRKVLTELQDTNHIAIAEIEISSKEQLEEIQVISKGPVVKRPEQTFLNLWNAAVAGYSSKTAVSCQTNFLTYETLNARANSIASYLQSSGVKKGDKVGVMLSRSEKSIIGILAALKTGAVYVPIDNAYPEERKHYIIKDAGLGFILTDSFSNSISEEREYNIDRILEEHKIAENYIPVALKPEDEAYIIYTSGSTGDAKGVVINHASLYDYVLTFGTYFNLTEEDIVLQQASTAFDTSVEEIFPILSVGGNLVIATDTKDFNELLRDCERFGITLLSTNPFVLQYLNDNHKNYNFNFKTIISGGDTLKPHQVDQLTASYDIYNTYGPTESTVCATYYKVNETDTSFPIGKPITNRGVYLLDGTKILPKGAIGEIGLSGLGLAVSYLNKKELTANAFININGERIYKTGDLGKWSIDNNLIFYGRKDSQLSYKGYRIEVGEIEQAIQKVNAYVVDSYVCINEVGGMPILIAYLVANESFINISSLVIDLKAHLPEFMIPTHFVILDAIPLIPNGKIDIKSLPEPKTVNIAEAVQLPVTPEEKEIASIWQELLRLDQVDVNVSFFELGGHSLLANQFISSLRDQKGIELSLRDFYKSPTIKEISELVPTLNKKEVQNIKAPEQELYPLSFSQERLWFLNQLNTADTSYHVSRAMKLKGFVEVAALEETFAKLIKKHEILRTVFVNQEGKPYQKILPPFEYTIPVIDYTGIKNKENKEKVIADSLERIESRAFEIEEGPLFRIELLKFSDQESVLVFCEHHLILDGWTQGILFRDFVDIYNELKRDPDFEAEKPEVTFKDYAYWERNSLNESVISEKLDYWENKFEGFSNGLLLPLDFEREETTVKKGGTIEHVFSLDFSEKLRQFSEKQDVSLFITMLAAFKIVLHKFSNQTDISVGTAVANRRYKEFQEVLGMIVNTIALRTTFSNENSLAEVLNEVKETCLDAYSYDDTPFGKVVERINPERSLNLHPLFQYMFSFVNVPVQSMSLLDADIEILNGHNKTSRFDISVVVNTVYEQIDSLTDNKPDRRISVEWDYNAGIFKYATMKRVLKAYLKVLEALVENPAQSLSSLDYISSSEKTILLEDFSTSKTAATVEATAVEMFEQQVGKNPDAVAVVFENRSLTYRELDAISNQLAHYLLNHYDIKTEDLIAVKLERSEWIYTSLLAVLKTGGVYVPIDPGYPEQRIAYIEQDSTCKVVIDEKLLANFISSQDNYPTTLPVISLTPENLMYVIYTSGSTGQPKGVMINHKSLVNYILNQKEEFGFDASDRIVQFSNNAFDASMEQIFLALLSGATLIGAPKERIIDPTDFINLLNEHSVTHLHATPGYLSHLEQLSTCKTLKRIVAAGEVCPKNLAEKMVKIADFYNKYGPTEATISAVMGRVEQSDLQRNLISIGKPLKDSQIYILSDNLALQPIGVFGELCISGSSLSRGYLNNPELTEEKFIAHPFIAGARLYKTGDLGRWLPDGSIELTGRKDQQVKVRGHRIELGEIEHALLSQDSISQCVVTVQDIETEPAIVAYVVGEKELDKQELRVQLSQYLPDYMLPGYYVQLDAIALTSHGKVDLKALPRVDVNDKIQQEYTAPVTTLEKQLVAIWEEILGIKTIGTTDNFFELGGHSLKVILVANKINRQLGYQISVKDVFLNPTISGIISKLETAAYTAIPKTEEQSNYVLTSSQHRLWILSQFEGGNQAYNIPGSFELEGNLNVAYLNQAFKTVINRHEILRTSFKRNEEGEVRQFIIDPSDIDFKIDYADFTTVENQQLAVEKRAEQYAQHPFDLAQAPLVNAQLVKLSENKHLLLFNMHHIISDGWSMGILSQELITIYDHLTQNKSISLPELSIQYKDYATWMRSEEQITKQKKSEAYWLEIFGGNLPVLELPTDKMRPKMKTYAGDSITHNFSKEASVKLKTFSEQHNSSLFMTLMAGINGLLSRYTNTRDLILGTPIAGREHSDLENQIGLYLNTLAIRTRFEETADFETLLQIQKETLLDAYSHQEYPLDNLVEQLGLGRDTSRSALFDVLVVLQNQQDLFASNAEQIESLTLKPYKANPRKVSQFDLSFIFSEKEEQLSLHIEYNTDIYQPEFVARLANHLDTFLTKALQNPEQKVATLNYLSQAETTQLLQDFNDTAVEYPKDHTIVDLFVSQAKKTPEQFALVTDRKSFTYKELDEISNELSHYLLSNYNLAVEDLVGVKLGRSEWLPIALLAVLKSGCAYVPIDPNYPAQRIEYIEQDSKCKITIDDSFIASFKQAESISKSLPQITFSAQQLAYIIYTSGSTGKPKGVMITHQNAVAMLCWSQREFSDTDFDTLYAVTSHCFDLSVYEFFYPLSIGKQIRLLANGLSIGDYIHSDKNVLINTVPSVIHTLIEKGTTFENAVGINLAGEAFPVSIANCFTNSGIAIRNLYGPSEDTTYSSYYRVEGTYESSVPIGKALDNTQFYVLSEELALQPVGVIGEICISGDGLSRGYLYQPELTTEKFIENPFKEDSKLYKTGDLGKWLPDGTIAYIGRKDSQVKIRGHRIELGEIEQVLQSQEEIDQCVVLTATVNGDPVIVSYLVSTATIDKQQLRQSLSRELPEYMLPSFYVFLDKFPLTPNGKIDKKALPPVSTEDVIQQEYIAPTNEIEEKLAAIWQDILKLEKIGITDNFFELGGNSLKATVLINRINKAFDTRFSIEDLYKTQSIIGVSKKLSFIIFQNQLAVETANDLDEVLI